MNKGLFSLLVGGLLAGSGADAAQDGKSGLLKRSVKIDQHSYSYQIYFPPGYQAGQKLPVIIFLHGIGQRGEDGFVPEGGAGGALVNRYLSQVPAIILLPQCRAGVYWSDPQMDLMVMQELEETLKEFGADAERIYLTGVSMGGYGVWHLASEHPERFAAIISICGGSPLRNGDRFGAIARRVGSTPAWVFHGADDRVVAVTESRQMVEALKKEKGNVRYSEYAGVGHNVWLKALAEKELLPWLLEQRLQK